MSDPASALEAFHPVVRRWFAARYGEPTEVQRLTWPRVAAGEHVLATAPTGSGKTLAAFLWALDRLLTEAWPGGRTRVLYVSPLRALNNDVQRNLLAPLAELSRAFAAAGVEAPEVRVLTRSGDTPQEERQRMARHPPEILITTPESLNILLTSVGGRAMLAGLRTVILDEVHAVVGVKRGVHLITAVERLVPLAGEVQRLALSATVRPLERVARWVGGARLVARGGTVQHEARPVATVASAVPKQLELTVRFPTAPVEAREEVRAEAFWELVVGELAAALRRNRSTLMFANSRRLVEKLTRLLNESEPGERIWSHHGSLSREIRAVVEERLKQGELAGIVATNSLELGIDIGSLDEVVLVQTPPSVASAVQRIGRAGHAVGETSRARLVPLVARDLLDAAVVARAVEERAIEEVVPVVAALDVLAQVILSMVATETGETEALYATVCAADPYRDLPRRHFDLTLEMLAGRYASTRVRQLRPLVTVDPVAGTVRGLPGAARLVYASGGTIPDRGYFHLRVADSNALLGELDEEFVWERAVGDTFTLGVQTWRIERITHNDVLVRPARARSAMAPFWRAEERNRSFALSERIAAFLERADAALEEPAFRRELEERHHLDAAAATALVSYLRRQKAATGGLLPHRHRIVAERVDDPQGKGEAPQLILHTLWGGRVNRPFALALQAAWERGHHLPLNVMHDDDCLVLTLPADTGVDELLALVTSANVEELLAARLDRSGFFGARFREAAGRALLLPREGFRRRTPLWLSRQRAKELLEAVSRYEDFPIVLEAWRTCLRDELDLGALHRVLEELERGEIRVAAARTDRPSPFAASVAWKRTNELMYEDDTPTGDLSRLRGDLLKELLHAPHLRPRLDGRLAAEFQAKLQRTHPGYAPRAEELAGWVEERVVLAPSAWDDLLAAVARDHGVGRDEALAAAEGRIAAVDLPGEPSPRFVAAVDALPRIARALGLAPATLAVTSPALDGAPAPAARSRLAALPEAPESGEDDPLVEVVAESLRFFAPLSRAQLATAVPLPKEALEVAVEALEEAGRVVVDELTEGAQEPEVCDAENLERLLRLSRAAARPAFTALPLDDLAPFLAGWQRVGAAGGGLEALREVLERLFGFVAPAAAWERDILPSRLEPYVPAWLDTLLAETDLLWVGAGPERLAFLLVPDLDLLAGEAGNEEPAPAAVLPEAPGRYTLEDLAASSGLTSGEVTRRLWEAAWRGAITSDSFAPVRRGAEVGFVPLPAEPTAGRPGRGRGGRRGTFERWRSTRAFAGAWKRLPEVEPPADPLETEELNRERARLVLERYGVVFRELLEHEAEPLRWGRLFRSLRLMELSGEVVAGQFFHGVTGLQFASHDALRRLREGVADEGVWWLDAADPASPCGLGLEGLPEGLPRRVATSHLVFHGRRLVVVSERSGRRLEIRAAPDHPRLPEYLAFLKSSLGRAAAPAKAVAVDEINGEPAAASPYRAVFERLFHVVANGPALRLSRRY